MEFGDTTVRMQWLTRCDDETAADVQQVCGTCTSVECDEKLYDAAYVGPVSRAVWGVIHIGRKKFVLTVDTKKCHAWASGFMA